MPWEFRPRLPTVSSMSAIPMAGNVFSYAIKGGSTATTSAPSRSSSPPPVYNRSAASSSASVPLHTQDLELVATSIAPEDLNRALVFQRSKDEAVGRSRYVAQGSMMLRASQDAQQDATNEQQLQFSRELYITSIEYLLRGIPSDLSDTEQESIRRSVITLYTRVGIDSGSAAVATQQDSQQQLQITQQIIVTFCRGTAVVIKKSIPKIKQGIEQAIEFENQYHVLERSGVALSATLMSMADKASRVTWTLPNIGFLTSMGQTLTLGLTTGIYEGYKVLSEETVC